MKIGRIAMAGPDGAVARLVRVLPEEGRVVDLAKAEVLRLQDLHAEEASARRLAAATFPGSMTEAISTGDGLLDAIEVTTQKFGDDASLPMEDVSWLPAADPTVLRDGLTFIGHIRTLLEKWEMTPPESLLRIPGYAKLSPVGIIGHEAEVRFPHYVHQMDHELELGYVVGRRGIDLHPENARQHLFGITIFNDFSGRDLQLAEVAIGMGATKSKDFASAIGPWITTVDEFDDLNAIPMSVRVNGETWGKGDSSNTLWTVDELLAYVSLGEYILPGDVIGSGTMGGGSGIELDRKLEPGDTVELEVGNVGILRNKLGEREPESWWPTGRDRSLLGMPLPVADPVSRSSTKKV